MAVKTPRSAAIEFSERSRARQLIATGKARELRVAAGISQAEIASRCGVLPSAVSRWENGSRRPRGKAAAVYSAIVLALADAAEKAEENGSDEAP
jgi:transcriptional regulator with XRE-family HTH domain